MPLSINKNLNPKIALKNVLSELNFNFGKRIYIKPNLSGREPILPGENTSIEVLDALIDFLYKPGCEIIIGHGALLGTIDHKTSFEETLVQSGYDKYLHDGRVKVINLDSLEREDVKIDEMIFHLPLKFLKEVDTYINLAKIKTHMEAAVSFSLKNQMGLPSAVDRIMMHKTDLEKTIAKLGLFCKPDLNILEGYPAMENNGPHHGTSRDLNIIVAGNDMVEVDSFVCELLGYDASNIKHIKFASDLKVGKFFEKNNIEKYKEYLVNDFKKADKVFRFGKKINVYPTYGCSRCINAVNNAGREFKKHPIKYWKILYKAIFSKKDINVVFGKADDLEIDKNSQVVCIGGCSKNFSIKYNKNCLDKCPPSIEDTRNFIVRNIK